MTAPITTHLRLLVLITLAMGLAIASSFGLRSPQSKPDAAFVRSLEDGRSGQIAFQSYSPSRSDLEAGHHTSRPVRVTGTLQLPTSRIARAPSAILLHGSTGVSPLQQEYAGVLLAQGTAVFVVDSFSGRGEVDTVGRQHVVGTHAMVMDAYAALNLVASHPAVDPDRIAIVGWSKGGVAALWSARERYRRQLARDKHLRFSAHVAFYPWCGEQEAAPEMTGAPALVLTGSLDDWSGADACTEFVTRARAAGYDWRIIVYSNAHHGFDLPGNFASHLSEATDWSQCRYLARSTGFVDPETDYFAPWSDLDEYLRRCSGKGAQVATNASARQLSRKALLNFLQTTLATDAHPNARLEP